MSEKQAPAGLGLEPGIAEAMSAGRYGTPHMHAMAFMSLAITAKRLMDAVEPILKAAAAEAAKGE